MSPKDELADELFKRLYDPASYVERGPHPDNKRKDRMEPLDMWKLRAVMDYFEKVQKREVDGKMVIVAAGRFRDKSPELDGE